MSSKYKYLLKNIGFLSISKFGSKFLIFFLIPLYTSVLSTEDYGSYDFIQTTVSLMIPIFTLKITEAVIRFSLDCKNSPKEVLSIGLSVFIKGLGLIITLLCLNSIFHINSLLEEYAVEFFLLYFSSVVYQIMSNFSRGMDRVLVLSVAGLILTAFTIGFNVLFLLLIKLGLQGYFCAIILGYLIASAYIFVRLRAWRYIDIIHINKKLKTEMIVYSSPLIVNSISWWINNAADRYTIIAICGVAANGVYSIAAKIPTILDSFQTIFSDAWILSAVKEYEKEDGGEFFSGVYGVYDAGLCIVCSLVILTTKILARILYSKEFYNAWVYVPFLTIAVLFGALSGFSGGIFASYKDTKTSAKTTAIGAIINIVLNILLVKLFGPLGAASATMISFFIVWVIRILIIHNRVCIKLFKKKHVLSYTLLLFQSICIIKISDLSILYVIQIISLTIQVVIYRDEVFRIIKYVRSRL